ncbi:3-oxoacyl-ACP synthase [Arenibacter sp. 6A1]|uniref:3-oxoacyl-ACP synthase n=1 Tax=Arenibacter sp. 6A1 TaxID=2720391 RepID=UPI00197BD7B1|nr:3-oxoacyl-ACP synthase [Arenibacter sp. 6A1]
MDISLKEQLYAHCFKYVEERLSRLQKNIGSLEEALTSETKSSAGDKHETGRAMIQLEREKLGQQLAEAQNLKEVFQKIPLKTTANTISLGSLVQTTGLHYYLSISVGEIKLQGQTFYAIAPNTPMGKLLMGKAKGDAVIFNTKEFTILAIN